MAMPSSAPARRFYRAAKQRFDDALLLLEMERTTAAVYLAGYSMDRIARAPDIWKLLRKLPDEVFVNITMLLLLTPEEAEHSLASQEFDHPIPSRV